jgi:hypothetical protein
MTMALYHETKLFYTAGRDYPAAACDLIRASTKKKSRPAEEER